jgi:hypothetical protein
MNRNPQKMMKLEAEHPAPESIYAALPSQVTEKSQFAAMNESRTSEISPEPKVKASGSC